MGVDHRGADIAVAKHLLNLSDVVVRLPQRRGARVPKGVWRNPRGHACMAGRRLESPLDIGCMPMGTSGRVWPPGASAVVREGTTSIASHAEGSCHSGTRHAISCRERPVGRYLRRLARGVSKRSPSSGVNTYLTSHRRALNAWCGAAADTCLLAAKSANNRVASAPVNSSGVV